MRVSHSNGLLISQRLGAWRASPTGECIGSNLPGPALRSSGDGIQRSDERGGIVESIIGMFSPYTHIARQVQAMFNIERAPGCRAEHGRFELVIRGAGMTDRPIAERVAFALQLTDAVRRLLRAESKRKYRRYGERAIAIAFEDEQVAANGIATSRFTYVASVEHDPDEALHRTIHEERESHRRR